MSYTPVIQRYGWRRDRIDPHDRIYNLEEEILLSAKLPGNYDLAGEMPPIYDQGQLGSCTANATGAIMQHAQMQQGEAEGHEVPSRLFIYYNERKHGGYPLDQDTGAEVRDGLWVLANNGAPPETDEPYDISRFAEQPSQRAYSDAKKYTAVTYKKILINSPGSPMRTAIVNHQPIAFGFPVPEQFEDPNWDVANEALPLPTAQTRWVGGHAVVVVGYDFTRAAIQKFGFPVFKIRNSWGEWGDAGHFYMDYRWFDPFRQLADDLWVVVRAS
jgi:C1A family cysteine protease